MNRVQISAKKKTNVLKLKHGMPVGQQCHVTVTHSKDVKGITKLNGFRETLSSVGKY